MRLKIQECIRKAFLRFIRLCVSRRYVARVSGNSLYPKFCDGDIVRYSKKQNIRKGDVVVCYHPYKSILLLKEVQDIDENGNIFVVGTDVLSEDSRSFGVVSQNDIRGVVKS